MRLVRANVERIATNAVDIAKLESEGFVPVSDSKIVDEAPRFPTKEDETAVVEEVARETERKKPGRKPKTEV